MISWQSIIYKPLQGGKLCQGAITENILNTLKQPLPQLRNAIFWFAWQLLNKKSIMLWGIWAKVQYSQCARPGRAPSTCATTRSGLGAEGPLWVCEGVNRILSINLLSHIIFQHWWLDLDLMWVNLCFLAIHNMTLVGCKFVLQLLDR